MTDINITDRLVLRLTADRGLGFGIGIVQSSGPKTLIEAGVVVGPFGVMVEIWPPQNVVGVEEDKT